MDFDQAKSKSLKEIIDQSDKQGVWAETSFMKLIDAKAGAEVSNMLFALVGAIGHLNADLQTVANNTVKSNEELARSNEKYARGLCWLTGGLVFVGLLQFLALILRKG